MKFQGKFLIGKVRELITKKSALRLIEFDTLNLELSIFEESSKENDIIVLIEPWEYLIKVNHHKKKVILILSAMRHFAELLKRNGWHVEYYQLSDKKEENTNFTQCSLENLSQKFSFEKIFFTKPSDFHWNQTLTSMLTSLNRPLVRLENNLFLATSDEFELWADSRKDLVMEFFYRTLRKKYQILIDDGQPTGGKWNYDQQNRQRPPSNLDPVEPFRCKPNKTTVKAQKTCEHLFPDSYGCDKDFHFATTTKEAEAALDYFVENHLENFGVYQDIMLQNNPWLYHSHLSFYLNIGLLTPMQCINKALLAYEKQQAPLNSVEGFIRQILGWREYIRGIYWLKMPSYDSLNHLEAQKPLPNFFWNNNSGMNCLDQSFKQTFELAYAHHIQRLMVIGNFSLIAGLNPQQVNEWFFIVYADAYPWVHLPNVSGMSLFADGGLLATKPYASSGSYINKMSNYCKHCAYNVKEKTGAKACPFNYLYWNFLIENREKFEKNHRMRMIYSTLDKMSPEKKADIIKSSEKFLSKL